MFISYWMFGFNIYLTSYIKVNLKSNYGAKYGTKLKTLWGNRYSIKFH